MGIRFAAFLGGMLWLSSSALAVELNYTWKKGEVHRFAYEDETRFEISLGALGKQNATIKVKSAFSEKVISIGEDGTAVVEFTLDKLDLYLEGKKAASLQPVPAAARAVKAELDNKGHGRFLQMVSVYLHDGKLYLGTHKLEAAAPADGAKGSPAVDLLAVVDRNGKVTAAMKIKEKLPASKTVTLKKEDPVVDALPRQILELLTLPEGHLAPGSSIETETSFGTITASMSEIDKGVAVVKLALQGKEASSDNTRKPGGEDDPPDVETVMGGNGMPRLGEGMRASADASMRFDTQAGVLVQMSGKIDLRLSFGPVGGIKTHTTFTLKQP